MKTMEDIRKDIDKIDDEIAELYVKRMALCKEIGIKNKIQLTSRQ